MKVKLDGKHNPCHMCFIKPVCDEKEAKTSLRKIHILGSEWTIKEQSVDDNELLKKCDGYVDWTLKEIVVERERYGTLGNMDAYFRKVLRHEIVHAFLYESGLEECSGKADSWATCEAMVDWVARQGQKIYAAWQEADALDI